MISSRVPCCRLRESAGEQPVPPRLPAGRRGRRRRPDAEPQSALRKRRAEAADDIRAERIHPDRQRRTDRPDHALCRDGPRHLHLHPDADRRRARGGSQAGAAGARSAQRKALCQPIAGRAGDRQLERDARRVAAAAPSRRNCQDDARSRPRQKNGMSIRRPAARKTGKCSIRQREEASNTARLPRTPPRCLFRKTSCSSEPQDFKLIGTPAKRLDTPAKVNGTAVYGIDVRPPGVKIATLAQSPVFGGRVKSVDDTAAKAVKGVRQIVRLDDAVAVVADHMGAAKKGLAALMIEWDDGPNAKLSTDDIAGELEKATLSPGRGRAEYR